MHTPHVLRRQAITIATALLAVVGVGAIASGVVFGSPSRPEASLTDPTAGPPGAFIAVSPMRVLDTRPAPQGPIGVAASGPISQNSSLDLTLAGDGRAIPARATSAFLNVTIDHDATVASFLTVWPTGEPRPMTSANNALPGLVASNAMLAKLGEGGSISIFNQQGDVNVVIDLLGYVVPLEVPTNPTAPPTVPSTAPPTTVPPSDPHAGLISGAGPPSSAEGSDGDFYLDTTNQVLTGPKTAGAWPGTGVALAGVQGAASAYNTVPIIVFAPTTTPVPIPFAVAGPASGSVARTTDTTFTVAANGLYRVEYNLDVASGDPGIMSVAVNGVPVGHGKSLAASNGFVNSVLVEAAVGDEIQLVFVPGSDGVTIILDNISILVEQTTGS